MTDSKTEADSRQGVFAEIEDGGLGWITIQREKVLNALNREVLGVLKEAVRSLEEDSAVRVIVVRGGGEKAFVAGADIGEMAGMDPLEARRFSRLGQEVLETIERCGKPVVAMVQGFALGGGLELALACHLRVASTRARFGLPEVGLGLIPGFGGAGRLVRLAGLGVAREWVLTGGHFSAEEAHRVGVVNRLVEPGELESETRKLAALLASRGPVAQALALDVLRRGLEAGQSEGQRAEADAFGLVFSSEDMREGTRAFLEKRKPSFPGR